MEHYFSSIAVLDERFEQRYNSPAPKDVDNGNVRVPSSRTDCEWASESNMSADNRHSGSRDRCRQPVWNCGTALFLEHMIFKGTKKRNLRQLEEEIEKMGGHLKCLHLPRADDVLALVLKEDVPVPVDILADILLNSSFQEDLINRERNVVLREMERGASLRRCLSLWPTRL